MTELEPPPLSHSYWPPFLVTDMTFESTTCDRWTRDRRKPGLAKDFCGRDTLNTQEGSSMSSPDIARSVRFGSACRSPLPRLRVAMLCLTAGLAATPVHAADQSRTYLARPVAEVLQELQAAGLRILFSSDLVTSELRVKSEPTDRDPRQVALQILGPHGL